MMISMPDKFPLRLASCPSAPLPQQVFLAVVSVAEMLDYQLAQVLRAEDITPAQYNVMRVLRGVMDEGHPCHEIASRLVKQVPDLTRVLDRLEARELISRIRETGDRRVVRVRIKPGGVDILNRLDAAVRALHHEQFSALSESEQKALLDLLHRIGTASEAKS